MAHVFVDGSQMVSKDLQNCLEVKALCNGMKEQNKFDKMRWNVQTGVVSELRDFNITKYGLF